MEEYQLFSQFISQVGFPMFVAVFMMTKQSKDTKQMSDTLNKLEHSIQLLAANAGVKGGGRNE